MEKMRILIADNKTNHAKVTAAMLKELGHDVIGMAHTHKLAVEMTRRRCPDLVLMDVNLGETDRKGIDTVASLQGYCTFQVIYITAHVDKPTIKRAEATNPLGYLVRPFRQSELLALLLQANHQIGTADTTTREAPLAFDCRYSKEKASILCLDREIRLTKNEQKLIELLIHANGSIVPFDTIEYEIWPDRSISSGAKRTLIYRINQKVGEKLIQKIQGIGCKILLR